MNKLVFTSKQIIEEGRPILYVAHDEDGDWQFLSTLEKDESDGRIVDIKEIEELDKSLTDLSWLQNGMEANRKDINSQWIVSIYG